MNLTTTDRIMDQLVGATITAGFVNEDEGLHIVMADGRCLVIAGMFALSIMRFDRERLH